LTFLLLVFAALAAQHSAQRVTGVVIDGASRTPIHGAIIALPNGKRLSTTNRAGKFTLMAEATATLQVSALDRASKIISLPKGPTDIDVGTVFLWRSARVTASLMPPFGATKVKWTLGRAEEGAKMIEVVREGVWTSKRPQIVIDNLEPGHYLLTFHGDGPLKTYAVPLTVDAGSETAVPVSITSTIVDLQVLSGDKPQPNAVVRFEHSLYLWKGTIDCDDQGKSTTELWQSGKFWVFTQSKGIVVDGQLQTLAGDKERDSVEIHLPAHSLRGHVVDASSGAAISDANISLEVAGKGIRNLVSDHDGAFEFEAVQEGRHALRAYKKSYRADRSTTITVSPQDADVESTVALTPEAAMREARVIDASGNPVPSADAFFGAGAYVQSLEATDDQGTVNVPDGTGTLFVTPPGGSFAVKTVSAEERSPIAVVVRPGVGSMTITSETAEHLPIPYIMFVLRVDGTLIPPNVIGRLAARQRMPFRTDSDGRAQLGGLPMGRYDIWAVRTRDELEAIFGGLAPTPSATVVLSSMPQHVTLTFERRP
jgi:hypothetical protein